MVNEILVQERIENMIYEVSGKQVMLDREISVTQCHSYFYYKIVTHYDIGKPTSSLKKMLWWKKIFTICFY